MNVGQRTWGDLVDTRPESFLQSADDGESESAVVGSQRHLERLGDDVVAVGQRKFAAVAQGAGVAVSDRIPAGRRRLAIGQQRLGVRVLRRRRRRRRRSAVERRPLLGRRRRSGRRRVSGKSLETGQTPRVPVVSLRIFFKKLLKSCRKLG